MTSEMPLAGKSALVTGASAGIGREVARLLAEDGADVAIAARREDVLEEVADAITADTETTVEVIPTDVADEDQVEAMVETAVETFGGLDIVVNNAAIGTARSVTVEDLPTEQYRDVMSVNTDGMFFVARAAIPHLRASRGNLIFVGSFAGNYPRSGSPVYAASKWWTRGFALSLAGQVGDEDIAVSVVSPSEVRTEFGKEYRSVMNKDRLDPGDVTEPEEVAEAVLFAARQDPPNAVAELNVYRRDKFSTF